MILCGLPNKSTYVTPWYHNAKDCPLSGFASEVGGPLAQYGIISGTVDVSPLDPIGQQVVFNAQSVGKMQDIVLSSNFIAWPI